MIAPPESGIFPYPAPLIISYKAGTLCLDTRRMSLV